MFPFPFSFVAPVASGIGTVDNVYSMEFDGVNDYFNAGTEVFTSNTESSMSISCWVKTTVGSANAIISKDLTTTGNRNFLLQLASGGLYWQTSTNASSLSTLLVSQATVNVLDGAWHHIAVTYNAGSTSIDGEKKIYVDGILRATDGAATILDIDNTPTVPIEIGRRGDGARYWNGSIDEVAFFNYALDSDQISEIYDATSTGVTADLDTLSTPPVAWYRMGD
jgi:hypothetical protein